LPAIVSNGQCSMHCCEEHNDALYLPEHAFIVCLKLLHCLVARQKAAKKKGQQYAGPENDRWGAGRVATFQRLFVKCYCRSEEKQTDQLSFHART
jgi:hypothetical protein